MYNFLLPEVKSPVSLWEAKKENISNILINLECIWDLYVPMNEYARMQISAYIIRGI